MPINNFKCLIEQLVYLHGDIKFDDLTYRQKLNLLSYAISHPKFDIYETYIESVDIPNLVLQMINGIYDEKDIGEEIRERLFDTFAPLIDKELEDEYENQYLFNVPIEYSSVNSNRI